MLTACANLISSQQHKQNLLKFAVTEQSTPMWWQAKMYNTKKKKKKRTYGVDGNGFEVLRH